MYYIPMTYNAKFQYKSLNDPITSMREVANNLRSDNHANICGVARRIDAIFVEVLVSAYHEKTVLDYCVCNFDLFIFIFRTPSKIYMAFILMRNLLVFLLDFLSCITSSN